jgi:GT2 family glycosyltransferase/Tfp pilus assembly protein PilF
MQDQEPVLLLPGSASGPDWEECVRTAREERPGLHVHRGAAPPLATRYIRLERPVWFAPGSLRNLLRAVDAGCACAVPVSNSGHPEENIAGLHPEPSLANHPNNRFFFATHLTATQAGQTRPIAVSERFCVASRAPVLPALPAATVVLDSFVYTPDVPVSAPPEESMILDNSSDSLPGLCIWVHHDCPDPADTLANMAGRPGIEVLLLNASGTPLTGVSAELDVWNLPADTSWNNLAPKLKRWFGDRNVLLLRAGLFVQPQHLARMASGPACTGPVESARTGQRLTTNASAWAPDAPLGGLPMGWLVANPNFPAPLQLRFVDNLSALSAEVNPIAPRMAPTANPPAALPGNGLPAEIQPHLMGFERLVVSGKGQTVDLTGRPCPQEGCDALLWKVEPTDIPGLAVRLRKLRLAGCRRLLISFENSFFQTPGAPYAHQGCSPFDVRREVLMAGFAINDMGTWPGCASAEHQENYFNTETQSQGWSDEEKRFATHARLWWAANACSEAVRTDKKVSVVLLALNKVDYTRKCIESLRAHCRMNLELILVNNGSTDGTRSYFDSIPGAKVIHNATNLGVAAGWNQGMRQATGDYILILNNDTIIAPRTIENLVRCAENHPDAGIVSPRSNNIAGPQMVEGFLYNSEAEIPGLAAKIQTANDLSCWEYLPLKGFCMLVPRAVAQKIGAFDERFGIGNFEDDDYCNRVFYQGYKLLVADDSFLFHFGSVSFDQANIDWQAQMDKNHALFDAKWENGRSVAFKAPPPAQPVEDEQTLRAMLAQDELNAEAYYKLGQLLQRRGDIQQAFSNYCKSLECDATRPEVSETTVQLLKSNYSEAEIADVMEFLRRRFPYAQAFRTSPSSPVQPQEAVPLAYNEAGIDLFGQGRYAEAQEAFERAWNQSQDIDTLLNLYDCSLHTGATASVRDRLEAAYRAHPQHAELRAAWQEMQSPLGHLPGDKVIYYREQNALAEKLLQEGQREQALEALQAILAEQPENYRALNTLGLLQWYNNNLHAAFDAFTKSLRNNGYYTEAYENLYDCAALANRLAEVKPLVTQALRLQPQEPSLQELQRHLEMGTHPKRLEIYADKLRANQKVQALVDKGNALLEQGAYNAATILFTDLLQEYPDNVEALNGVGISAFQRGDIQDAFQLFAHALKLKPNDQDSLLNLWEAAGPLGRKSDVRAILQSALDQNPALSAIAQALQTGDA